jgi:hypothetical protein
MGLWYRIDPENENTTFETIDLVCEFIDIWLQTRKAKDIDPRELSGVIDVLYDFQPVPGEWVLVEIRPAELAQYITTYINDKGTRQQMMQEKDHKLSNAYVKLFKKKYQPTPLIIAGVADEVTGEEGIVLIDGRHRTFAAIKAGVPTLLAYINKSGLEMLDKAKIPTS